MVNLTIYKFNTQNIQMRETPPHRAEKLHLKQAAIWDFWVNEIDKDEDRLRAERFLGKINHSPPYLDIGCGPGRVLEALAQSGETQIYGIDLSEKMIERARQRMTPYLKESTSEQVLIGDMMAIDQVFPDQEFATIFLSRVLQQTYRRLARSVLESVAKISSPNAQVFLSVRSTAMAPREKSIVHGEPGSYRHRTGWIKTYYRESDLNDAARGLFDIQSLRESRGSGPNPMIDWHAELRRR